MIDSRDTGVVDWASASALFQYQHQLREDQKKARDRAVCGSFANDSAIENVSQPLSGLHMGKYTRTLSGSLWMSCSPKLLTGWSPSGCCVVTLLLLYPLLPKNIKSPMTGHI